MNIVITGSLGHIGKPLTQLLVAGGHNITVITSKKERQPEIEALGAKAAIGSFQDAGFLTATFKGADIVYLMEAWEGIGSIFDKNFDFVTAFEKIGYNYKQAVEQAGVRRIVHLSSIGAHTTEAVGSLQVHNRVEGILNQLPAEVAIKFMRPVGFYTNMFRWMDNIRTQGAIVQAYGGDRKEPWVAPQDIAAAIAGEMELPFTGRTVHYVASDEVSPNEVAEALGKAIGNPGLKWMAAPADQVRDKMLSIGMNEWIAQGFVDMQAAQGNGSLYEDYYRHQPVLGGTKLADFAKEFARVYHQNQQS